MKAMPSTKPNMRERITATIRGIPRGKVSTYGAVAKAAGFPGAARQVVAALRGAVGLPWQRVLGAGGAIRLRGDYAFEQRFRLEAEGVTFRGRKVDMKLHEHRFPRSAAVPAAVQRASSPAAPRARRPRDSRQDAGATGKEYF
jgi:methylated-DNA-protein-cysteine methyltransferase related protein